MRKTLIALPFLALTALPQGALALIPGDVAPASQPQAARFCPPAATCAGGGMMKHALQIEVGDMVAVTDDMVQRIKDPRQYELDPQGTYYQVGNKVVQVNRDTLQIIRLVGTLSHPESAPAE
ncbi:hypothetical protein [Pseudooceanicola sp. HF7]|uniref:hypothetical protein n=1 Tax=Pseudooceanicola sp. HF7 TaxID=2721560 RepID=UPI001430C13A|nr:hypothetical protein [Pseudooceanicola sp. HF7]NIZ11585.1 hypothetical protein [Pseudooceanicola sp. HF7]